jgi:hypothetical protein
MKVRIKGAVSVTAVVALSVVAGAFGSSRVSAQQPPAAGAQQGGRGQGRGGAQAGAPPSARANAPIDLTGYWVALVTDDWRWRMVTPPKGDVMYLPVTDAARRAAEQWDPAKDEAAGDACKGYGAGGIMRLPERLHVTWDGDNVLKMEIDTGQQTRVFTFGDAQPPAGDPTWQGFSRAQWDLPGAARGRGGRGAAPGPRPGSTMRVVTTRMRPGYWQKNGVPYGANAVMTEWFTTLSEPNGDTYLLVTKQLEDPQFIQGVYYRTVQFKKQNDATGWNPTPCSAR